MSRSLANAKASRSGERAPPVSGNRPITSIRSQSAFQQQYAPPTNVRTQQMQRTQPPRQIPPQIQRQQMQQQQMQQQQQMYQQQPPMQQDIEQPFKKLSISDAIGLITLRLGRVEQWIIETDHENEEDNKSNPSSSHQVIDNSILTSIIHRLDSLEKNTTNPTDMGFSKETIQELKDQLQKMEQSISKQSSEFIKQSEQVFKFNRDLVETKDLLKTFMMKYDGFCNEVGQQFIDYETALADLESKLHIDESTAINDIPGMSIIDPPGTSIENIQISLDLKNEIEKELENVLN